jgi:hypothetical protein
MILSAIGLSALTIIAVSLVAFPILSGGTLPFWQGTTSSQTAVTSTTGGALSVQINIANNPTTLGGVQTVIVSVLDPGGQPVPQAQVHLEVTYPSGQVRVQRDGQTDTSGSYSATWQITGVPENVGAYQVRVSATKTGYQTGQAEAAFQVTLETVP